MPRASPLLMALPLAGPLPGCTDYEFSKGSEHIGRPGRGDGGPPGEADTGAGSQDTGGGTYTDTDTSTDACWEPEDGYTQNPAARLYTTDGVTPSTVTFVASSTDYEDDLWLDAPEQRFLARAWQDAPGTTQTVGPYAAGTELIFGIDIWDTGEHFQSGPASRNSDGVVHVAATYEGGCSWLIGFEDLTGGGDLDYNDVVLRVQGMLRQDR